MLGTTTQRSRCPRAAALSYLRRTCVIEITEVRMGLVRPGDEGHGYRRTFTRRTGTRGSFERADRGHPDPPIWDRLRAISQ